MEALIQRYRKTMSNEDRMVDALIEWATDARSESDDREFSYDVEIESHYNYYGNRGVADPYIRETEDMDDGRTFYYDKVYEIKSEAALKEVTGANEIIRQFNKMRKYFYKDESRSVPTDVHFELVFLPTESTIEHLVENMNLYQTCEENKLCEEVPTKNNNSPAIVTVRDHSTGISQPAQLRSPFTEVDGGESWKAGLKEIGGDNTSPQKVVQILDQLGY